MPIKNLLAHKYSYLCLALAWTLLIAVLCLIDFSSLPKMDSISGADKYVHATFHFVFTMLWYLHFERVGSGKKLLLKAFCTSLFYGISIEIMQGLFTKTRHADVCDVAANSVGATLAILTLIYYKKYQTKKLSD